LPQAASAAGAGNDSFVSRWVFDVDKWAWQHKEGGCADSPWASRWSHNTATVGSTPPAQQAATPHGAAPTAAPRRQRVMVVVTRGAGEAAGGWSSVGGLAKQKQQLEREVLAPLRHPWLFRRLGVAAVRGELGMVCTHICLEGEGVP
jgi:hypothetical protein